MVAGLLAWAVKHGGRNSLPRIEPRASCADAGRCCGRHRLRPPRPRLARPRSKPARPEQMEVLGRGAAAACRQRWRVLVRMLGRHAPADLDRSPLAFRATLMPKKIYNSDYRAAAVELSGCRGVRGAAAELGVHMSLICRWRKAAAAPPHLPSTSTKIAGAPYPVAEKARALNLALSRGVAFAQRRTGISRKTLDGWVADWRRGAT